MRDQTQLKYKNDRPDGGRRVRGGLTAASAGAAIAAMAVFGAPGTAHAIPAFAAQTGQPCSACHIGFPQLTPYGRDFKLEGYVAGGMFPTLKNFAAMVQTGETHLNQGIPGGMQPGFRSNNAWAAQQISVFYGGALDARIGLGAFVQVTYDGIGAAWGWDNTDIRLAHHADVFGKNLFWGVTLNNNPTVTDLWNTPPSWGFPYVPSNLAPGPTAGQQVANLGGQVYGIGAYGGMNVTLNDLLYAEADLYKTLPGHTAYALGVGDGPVADGVIPYVRLALQHQWQNNSVEIGTYALYDRLYANGKTGPTNDFFDMAFDSQFQWITKHQALSVYANYIHESQSYAPGQGLNSADTLDSLTFTVSELLYQKIQLIESYNTIYGSADPGLYSVDTGNANGKPNTNSWTTEIDYYPFNNGGPAFFPWMNFKLFLEDTLYTKFNGRMSNYDGSGRSAGANNTIYGGIWLVF